MHQGTHYYREPSHNLPLTVVASGTSLWSNGAGFEREFTGFWGLELVTHGVGEFEQEGRRYHIREGDLFVLRQGAGNRYRALPCGCLCKRYVQIRGAAAGQIAVSCGFDSADKLSLAPVVFKAVKLCLREIHRLLGAPIAGVDETVSVLAYRIFAILARHLDAKHESNDYARSIMEWIRNNVGRPLTARECASRAGISLTHLNRLMNAVAGCSVKQFIVKQKMELAAHLLAETAQSVSLVAVQCGYEDPLYFSNRFRIYYKQSPSEYRHRVRLTHRSA